MPARQQPVAEGLAHRAASAVAGDGRYIRPSWLCAQTCVSPPPVPEALTGRREVTTTKDDDVTVVTGRGWPGAPSSTTATCCRPRTSARVVARHAPRRPWPPRAGHRSRAPPCGPRRNAVMYGDRMAHTHSEPGRSATASGERLVVERGEDARAGRTRTMLRLRSVTKSQSRRPSPLRRPWETPVGAGDRVGSPLPRGVRTTHSSDAATVSRWTHPSSPVRTITWPSVSAGRMPVASRKNLVAEQVAEHRRTVAA